MGIPSRALPGTDLQLFMLILASVPFLCSLVPVGSEPWALRYSEGQIGSLDSLQHSNPHVGFQLLWGCLLKYSGLWFSLPASSINTIPFAFWTLETYLIFYPLVSHQLFFLSDVGCLIITVSGCLQGVDLKAVSSKHASSVCHLEPKFPVGI